MQWESHHILLYYEMILKNHTENFCDAEKTPKLHRKNTKETTLIITLKSLLLKETVISQKIFTIFSVRFSLQCHIIPKRKRMLTVVNFPY